MRFRLAPLRGGMTLRSGGGKGTRSLLRNSLEECKKTLVQYHIAMTRSCSLFYLSLSFSFPFSLIIYSCFTSLCYTADGRCILAGGRSKFICIYNVAHQILLKKFQISRNRAFDGMKVCFIRRCTYRHTYVYPAYMYMWHA